MDWFRNLFSSNKAPEEMELENLDETTSQTDVTNSNNQYELHSNNVDEAVRQTLADRKVSTSLQPSLLTKLRNYFSGIYRPHEVILGTIALAALITATVGSIISCATIVAAGAAILIGISALNGILNKLGLMS